ncbi:hypothetical protein VTN96DRAFT_3482 [Rasamsonia emersonii]
MAAIDTNGLDGSRLFRKVQRSIEPSVLGKPAREDQRNLEHVFASLRTAQTAIRIPRHQEFSRQRPHLHLRLRQTTVASPRCRYLFAFHFAVTPPRSICPQDS